MTLKKWLNLATLLVCAFSSSQTNYTNYFLKNNSSKIYYNPALYQTNSYVEHFDLLSECVQINTNINYTDLIQKGSGELKDSLVLNIHRFISKLDQIGYLDLKAEINYFTMGIGVNSQQVVLRKKPQRYIEFSVKERNNINIDFNKNYLLLMAKGNAPFYHEHFSTGHAGINLTSYKEFAITHSRPLSENLVVGLRLKSLFGQIHFSTKAFEFDLNGRNNNRDADTSVDVHFQMSGPIDVTLNADGFFESLSIGSLSSQFQFKNPGIAFDLGVAYDFTPKIHFGASINDVGKIWWSDQTKQLAVNTSYKFNPFDLGQFIDNEDNSSVQKWLAQTSDELKNTYRLTKTFDSYSETLPFVANTSLQYEVNSFFDVGLLLTHRVAHHFHYSNLIVSTNLGIYDYFSLSPVLVLQDGSYFVGCSTSFRINYLQFSLTVNDLHAIASPAKVKGLGAAFGISYIIEPKKRWL